MFAWKLWNRSPDAKRDASKKAQMCTNDVRRNIKRSLTP